MFGFVTVPAGSPSSAGGLARHLLTPTLPDDVRAEIDAFTGILACGVAEVRPDIAYSVAQGLGITPSQQLTKRQLSALMAGRRADGSPIEGRRHRGSGAVGSVDFSFTADKSVSVAFALATGAERAAIYQAHREAAESAMSVVAERIGQARRGAGGMAAPEPGHIGWVAFDHFTSRPTLSDGVLVRGDPDLHTHFTVINAVFCDNGRVGSLSMGWLAAGQKEIGALYHAFLADNLRALGIRPGLDIATGAARIESIPPAVRDHFCKKTRQGEEVAREYAGKHGIAWDELTAERRARLMKQAVQGAVGKGADQATARLLRRDDMADFAGWHRQAQALDYRHNALADYRAIPAPENRLEVAQKAAEAFITHHHPEPDGVLRPVDWRVASARGLIASGIERPSDVNLVAARLGHHAPDAGTKVEITSLQADRLSRLAREERRQRGQLGPDLARLTATDGERRYEMRLAIGDKLRLFGNTRAETGRGGSLGGTGSVVTVTGIEANRGLALQNESSHEGFVPWKNMAREEDGTLRLAYGDVRPVSVPTVKDNPSQTLNRRSLALRRATSRSKMRGVLMLERQPETSLHEALRSRAEEIEAAPVLEKLAGVLERAVQLMSALPERLGRERGPEVDR